MSGKKQLLVIGPGMDIGGIERSLLGLLDSIDYDRYEVDLFLLSHGGDLMPLLNGDARLLPEENKFALIAWPIVKLFRKGHFLLGSIRLYSKLYGAIRARITKTPSLNITICKRIVSAISKPLPKHYDCALGFYAPHYFLENKTNAAQKIGWVHTDFSSSYEKQDVRYLRPMWEKLDRIVCVSDGVKQAFDGAYRSLRDKTIVFENIVSQEYVRKQADVFDAEPEMPEDGCFKLLSVGRFCTAKAFDEIPEACSILKSRGIRFRWYLIGFGPDEALIRKRIRDFRMEDTVIVLGKKQNPYPYMKRCDLYVQPSRYEGKAVTVQEARALGKPVMITRYATSASQLKEGVDGYICEMGPSGVADGLEKLLTDADLRKRISQQSDAENPALPIPESFMKG